ncbi:hypothetical protein NQZ79_g5306 [Umbelopsis isabellina]|nr:hypothetical protein NQZ79_g5306 [Umbelopsis isabellina]
MKLSDLPLDVLIQDLLPRLPYRALIDLSKTSKFFYRLCGDESLWKKLALRELHIPTYATFRNRGWKDIFSKLHDPLVYTWGEGTYYRLGHTDVQPRGTLRNYRNDEGVPRELEALRGKKIVDLVAGGWFFHALDRYGKVWAWGTLQVEWPISRGAQTVPIKTPTVVNLPEDVSIESISCGRSHAVALSTEGTVYHWNHIRKVQQVLIPESTSRVIQVSANWGYSSILTEAGELFFVPQPENALEGAPAILTTEATSPGVTLQNYINDAQAMGHPVENADDDQFALIASMQSDTLILTKKGKVYLFDTAHIDIPMIEDARVEPDRPIGWPPLFVSNPAKTGGELKHYSSSTQNNIVDSEGHLTMFISAFYHNFAVYSLDGVVKLGSCETALDAQPRTMDELNQDICKVTFGDYHSGALTTEGDLLTWGSHSRGALGLGTDSSPTREVASPRKIEALNDMFVFAASFGGWHSGCLAFTRTN